jgi:hypothetical protein
MFTNVKKSKWFHIQFLTYWLKKILFIVVLNSKIYFNDAVLLLNSKAFMNLWLNYQGMLY